MRDFIYTKKESIISLFISGISLIIFYNNYSNKFFMLSPNEVMYMGNLFKSLTSYSAYFGYDNGFGQYYLYENFLKFFINIFPNYFYLVLNIFIASLYILSFVKFFKAFDINIYLLPLFSLWFFSEKFYKKFGGLNWTEEGIAEPRQLGWVFLIFSIAYFYEKKYYLSIFYLTITSYFYFVVILLLIPLFLFLLIRFKVHFKYLTVYSILVSPYLLFLYSENATSNSISESLKIYIVERHPHHLYPFENGVLRREWYPSLEIYISLLLFCFLITIFLRLIKNPNTVELSYLIYFLLALLSIYLVFTYFFPINRFILLMPIRIYNILYFILLISFFSILSSSLNKVLVNLILFGTLVPLLFVSPLLIDAKNFLTGNYVSEVQVLSDEDRGVRLLKLNSINTDHSELINFIKSSLDENDVLLIKDENYLTISLEMTTGVNAYVLEKIIPKSLDNVKEWKNRKFKKLELINECRNSIDLNMDFFILSRNIDSDDECGSIVFTNETYKLSKLK